MELFDQMVQLLGESAELMPATTAAPLLLPTTVAFASCIEADLNPLHYFIINQSDHNHWVTIFLNL